MNKNRSLKATPRLLQKSTRHSPQGFKPAPSALPESLLQILGHLCHSIRNARVDGYLDVLINPLSDAPTVKVYEPLSKDYVSRNVAILQGWCPQCWEQWPCLPGGKGCLIGALRIIQQSQGCSSLKKISHTGLIAKTCTLTTAFQQWSRTLIDSVTPREFPARVCKVAG